MKESRFAIEGHLTARALRSGLAVDAVMFLEPAPKSIATVFDEWRAKNRLVHVISPDIL